MSGSSRMSQMSDEDGEKSESDRAFAKALSRAKFKMLNETTMKPSVPSDTPVEVDAKKPVIGGDALAGSVVSLAARLADVAEELIAKSDRIPSAFMYGHALRLRAAALLSYDPTDTLALSELPSASADGLPLGLAISDNQTTNTSVTNALRDAIGASRDRAALATAGDELLSIIAAYMAAMRARGVRITAPFVHAAADTLMAAGRPGASARLIAECMETDDLLLVPVIAEEYVRAIALLRTRANVAAAATTTGSTTTARRDGAVARDAAAAVPPPRATSALGATAADAIGTPATSGGPSKSKDFAPKPQPLHAPQHEDGSDVEPMHVLAVLPHLRTLKVSATPQTWALFFASLDIVGSDRDADIARRLLVLLDESVDAAQHASTSLNAAAAARIGGFATPPSGSGVGDVAPEPGLTRGYSGGGAGVRSGARTTKAFATVLGKRVRAALRERSQRKAVDVSPPV